ncbi:MAG: Xaa-Pro dipeptidase [Enterobacterales bacterium]|nr:Xaa-Pro dipeptidase [Enterobacterales bacterium]
MFDKELFHTHLNLRLQQLTEILTQQQYAGIVIPSGRPHRVYLDDNDYTFKPNFHFSLFIPEQSLPASYLLIRAGEKPQLIYYQPADYWHVVPGDPDPEWAQNFEVIVVSETDTWQKHLAKDLADWVWVGEPEASTSELFAATNINPSAVVHALHYERAIKTDYELDCLARANIIAARGHMAAYQAFISGATELEIHLEYLNATQHTEQELPYNNIIALGPHGAVLHYTELQKSLPDMQDRQSFLIDAGAKVNNYCSDITRTWSINNEFSELIADFDILQLNIVKEVRAGVSFVELHRLTHQYIAQFMLDHDLATGSSEQLLDAGITATFYPHGLGHLLGLQVHDIGGHQSNAAGDIQAPPAEHPFLRLTRTLEPGFCVTIEPGLYFIDLLLDKLKQRPEANLINWKLIQALKPFGGIRIEDDVVATEFGHINLSRQAFQNIGANV